MNLLQLEFATITSNNNLVIQTPLLLTGKADEAAEMGLFQN